MLTLRRIDVEGFGPFADRALLTLPEERGVTVVYGDNMRGKTSLMNAIRYAFLGEVHGRGGRTRGLLAACNRDRSSDGQYGFVIGLSVRYEDADFDLIREVVPKVAVPRSDGDFATSVSLRRGGVVLGPAERTKVLRGMLPRDVARFFLFDGELLDEYAELLISGSEAGRVISEAIEQILGVPMLRDARNHLATLASTASRASAKEASKHQTTEAMGNALQCANDRKEAHEQERDRKAAELDGWLVEREEIETKLRHQTAYAAAVERLDGARKRLEEAQNARERMEAELRTVMGDAWRTVLEGPVAEARAATDEAVKEGVAALVGSLRREAVDKGHCRTCDREVPEDVRIRLAGSLGGGEAAVRVGDGVGMAALARRSELDRFRRKDVRGEARLIWGEIHNARLDEADARGRIADANKTLEDQDAEDIRGRKTTLTELGGKIRAARDAIAAEQARVDEQEAAIARLTKALEASLDNS